MPESPRQPEHARNPALESLLADLARDLEQGSGTPPAPADQPAHPPVFLVGTARSGTTLALQWLAAGGRFTYPTNLVSRFPTAPWVGERVARLLTDPECDHRGELTLDGSPNPEPWSSDLGKTRGLAAPHEFWYWWRRFLPEDPADEPVADAARMSRELAAWEAVRGKPILMKALMADWHIPWLADAFPRALFIHTTRDPVCTMRSLLKVRREFYGDENPWYSFRPPEYGQLKNLPPVEQVAGQVYHTELAVRQGLAELMPERCFTLPYADLCAAPEAVHRLLTTWLVGHGIETWERPGPDAFPDGDAALAGDPRREELHAAWRDANRTGYLV
jgi:hypothetical protein